MAWVGDYLFTMENIIIMYLSIILDIALGESSLKITLKFLYRSFFFNEVKLQAYNFLVKRLMSLT